MRPLLINEEIEVGEVRRIASKFLKNSLECPHIPLAVSFHFPHRSGLPEAAAHPEILPARFDFLMGNVELVGKGSEGIRISKKVPRRDGLRINVEKWRKPRNFKFLQPVIQELEVEALPVVSDDAVGFGEDSPGFEKDTSVIVYIPAPAREVPRIHTVRASFAESLPSEAEHRIN